MKRNAIISAISTIAYLFLIPILAPIAAAQEQDRDRERLQTQQRLQEQEKLQTGDRQTGTDQLQEQERDREQTREQTRSQQPERPQFEKTYRGGGGGRGR